MPKSKTKKLEYVLIIVLIVYLGAMGLEFSLFNLRHWTTSFISPTTNVFEHGGYTVERIDPLPYEYRQYGQPRYQQLRISDINHPVRTVYINPRFRGASVKTVDVTITYLDENRRVSHFTQIINGYPASYHIPLGAMGDVEYISVIIHDARFLVDDMYLNMPLLFRFQWARVILVTLIVSLILFWKTFGFSRFLFNPYWGRQRFIDGGVMALFVSLLFFIMLFSVDFGFVPGQDWEFGWTPNREGYTNINAMMAEALLQGRLHLDIEPHYTLLSATHPYNITYRYTHGVRAPWDHVFFEGRIYSYFGIVPVVVLFLPAYLLLGGHVSTTVATFIFSAFASIGVFFLWKAIAAKYFKDMPFTMYLAGLVVLLFGTNLMVPMVRPYQYEVAIASGLMFSVWGIYFIFRAIYDEAYDRIKKRYLVLGGAFLALAVGARPTMLIVSLLVPVMLLPFIRSCLPIKNVIKDGAARKNVGLTILALAVPYMVIGTGLAWYNYARFGSIFEFGATYQITAENVGVVSQTGLLGNLRRGFDGFFTYFFSSFVLRPQFPFVFPTRPDVVFTGHFPRGAVIGVFILPISWFLLGMFYLRRKADAGKAMHIIMGLAVTGFLIAVMSSVLIGPLMRYTADFFWLFMFASVICMGFVYRDACALGTVPARFVRWFAFAAVGVTCFLLFGWGMVGDNNFIARNNPVVFRFLADLFLIF